MSDRYTKSVKMLQAPLKVPRRVLTIYPNKKKDILAVQFDFHYQDGELEVLCLDRRRVGFGEVSVSTH